MKFKYLNMSKTHLSKEQLKIVEDIYKEKSLEHSEKLNEYQEKINKLKPLSHERKVLILEVVDNLYSYDGKYKAESFNNLILQYGDDLLQIHKDVKNKEEYTIPNFNKK